MKDELTQPQSTSKGTNWVNILIGVIVLVILIVLGTMVYNSFQSKPLTSNPFTSTETITAERAIEIANASLVKDGHNLAMGGVDLSEFNISATDTLDNTDKKYVKTQNPVWKVFYGPKKIQFGGDITLYVDKTNGKLVGGYLGQ